MCKLVKNKFEVLKMIFSIFLAIVVLTSQVFALGWFSENGEWYYQDTNGQFLKNVWLKDTDGSQYYFMPSGAMATDGTVGVVPIQKNGKADYTGGKMVNLGDNVTVFYPTYVENNDIFNKNHRDRTNIGGIDIIYQSVVSQKKSLKFSNVTKTGYTPNFYMVVTGLDDKTVISKSSSPRDITTAEWSIPYSNCHVFFTTRIDSMFCPYIKK